MTPKGTCFRRGFTLIEILVVVAIIAIMTTVGVAGVRAGQGAARVRAAARDIFATIRHARSVALVSQEPSVITYYTDHDGEEVCSHVEIVTAKLMSDKGPVKAETLAGESVTVGGDDESAADAKLAAVKGKEDGTASASGGQTVADVLFAPIPTDVVRGVRILVKREGESLSGSYTEEQTRSKISVFSTTDYILGLYQSRQSAVQSADKTAESASGTASAAASTTEDQPRVSFVWEVNGRCEPHRVYVFRDGSAPEKGLCIRVDRFGAAKILGEDDEE